MSTANATCRVLVLSCDSAVLRPFWLAGEANGWQLERTGTLWQAMDKVQSDGAPDLLLLDLSPEDFDGLQMLRWVHQVYPALPVVLIDSLDDDSRRQEAIRMGASDYLVKPVDIRQLEASIRRGLSPNTACAEPEVTSADVEPVGNGAFFIGAGPAMQRLRTQLGLLSQGNMPVLIVGEEGSGKETAARLIHRLSIRSGFEFARVNCAALPEDLLERELFGVERTGSRATTPPRRGKLEICARGSILLDEITELPLLLQGRIVQMMQKRGFSRPGSGFIHADVRLFAAGPAKMKEAVAEGRFRADLYQYLSQYEIHVPPLREREEEIPLLARHFMHKIARHYGVLPRELSPSILAAWQNYSWPGNLTQLETAVKRYLILGDQDIEWTKADAGRALEGQADASLPPKAKKQPAPSYGQFRAESLGSKSLRALVQHAKSETERNAIALALETTGWNRKAAARLLKVSYRTVLYKIEEYQMIASNPPSLPMSR